MSDQELAQTVGRIEGTIKTGFKSVHDRLDTIDDRLNNHSDRLDGHDRRWWMLFGGGGVLGSLATWVATMFNKGGG